MTLRSSSAAHLAPAHFSLTGERRLLSFANPQHREGGPEGRSGGNPDVTKVIETLLRKTRGEVDMDMRGHLIAETTEAAEKKLFETAKMPGFVETVLRTLSFHEESDLEQILISAGIVESPADAKRSVLHQLLVKNKDTKYIDENGELTDDPTGESLVNQICTYINTTKLTDEQRKNLIHQLFARQHIATRMARFLQQRMDFQASLADMLNPDPHSGSATKAREAGKTNEVQGAFQQLKKFVSARVPHLLSERKRHPLRDGEADRNLAEQCNALAKELEEKHGAELDAFLQYHTQRLGRTSEAGSAEWKQEKSGTARELVFNTLKELHREGNFGGLHYESPIKALQAYSKQAETVRLLLDTRLQARAEDFMAQRLRETEELLKPYFETALKKLDAEKARRTPPMTADQEIDFLEKEISTQMPSAEKAFIAEKGFGISDVNEIVGKQFAVIRRIQRIEPEQNVVTDPAQGEGKPLHDELPDAKGVKVPADPMHQRDYHRRYLEQYEECDKSLEELNAEERQAALRWQREHPGETRPFNFIEQLAREEARKAETRGRNLYSRIEMLLKRKEWPAVFLAKCKEWMSGSNIAQLLPGAIPDDPRTILAQLQKALLERGMQYAEGAAKPAAVTPITNRDALFGTDGLRDIWDNAVTFFEQANSLTKRISLEDTALRPELEQLNATPENAINAMCKETREKLGSLFNDIRPLLMHNICRTLGIEEQLREYKGILETDLWKVELNEISDLAQKRNVLARGRLGVSRFTKSIERLKAINSADLNTIGLVKREPLKKKGKFDYPYMVIDSSLNDEEARKALYHEKGHYITHELANEILILPDLVDARLGTLADEETGLEQGQTFEQLLWSIRTTDPYREAEQTVQADMTRERGRPIDLANDYEGRREWMAELMDELIARHASGETPVNAAEERLFRMLEGKHFTAAAATFAMPADDALPDLSALDGGDDDNRNHPRRRRTRYMTGTTINPDEDDETNRSSGPESAAKINMKQELIELERMVKNLEDFAIAYDKFDPIVAGAIREKYAACHEHYLELDHVFRKKKRRSGEPYPPDGRSNPEDNEHFIKMVKDTKEHTDKVLKYIKQYDQEKLDVSKEKPKKPAPSWRFISFNDIKKFWKDSWQDIQDMYQRKQDMTLKQTGRAVTYAVRNSGIRYASSLWAYHERRYSGTEVEAADKWKKGLENEDTHSVLDMLADTRDKDQMRGGIALLCSRGEMDWNNWKVWRNLSRFAGMEMPRGPCERSDILRDIWLKKLITKIWDDRELYYHFRTENDSKIDSGKNGFTANVDQLSNVSGGMRGELRKQLRLYREYHHANAHPPEDVKPHLYEKVIEYAIKNGKMTMEDKLYYLVQGVADGLLSIDRLRALAGEKGGLLQIFPVIDYFYQKNNSLDEIKKIAKRIETPGKDCEPGLNTTLWLFLEVLRDEGVRARLSKGSARIAEGIDHEDIPHFITQLDYREMENLADVISGSRQKVTPEGWKNAYVGFNAKFKIFGQLLKLEHEGQDRFTASDAGHLANIMGTFIHMDNILTNNASDGKPRPSLSEYQFTTSCPAASGDAVTGDYRVRMNAFIQKILTNDSIKNSIHLTGEIKDDAAAGGKRKIQLSDYASIVNPTEHTRAISKGDNQKVIFSTTKEFVRELQKALVGNFDVFKQLFQEFVEEEAGFIDMGGSEFNSADIQTFIDTRKKQLGG